MAAGAHRIFLGSQIAKLGLRRLRGGLRSALIRAVARFFVKLGLHSGIFVCLGFIVKVALLIRGWNHRWPGPHHDYSPAKDGAEHEQPTKNGPRAGTFAEREHNPERIQHRFE